MRINKQFEDNTGRGFDHVPVDILHSTAIRRGLLAPLVVGYERKETVSDSGERYRRPIRVLGIVARPSDILQLDLEISEQRRQSSEAEL